MNNKYQEGNNPCCYFHPKETIVGICALCLRERLVSLVSKQGHTPTSKDSNRAFRVLKRRPTISLSKLFAFSSFLNPNVQPQQSDEHCVISDKESSVSLDDSFISIKFEENGQASWNSKKLNAAADPSLDNTKSGKAIIETVNQKGMLRWRKRIGQLLKMARLKRSSKANIAGKAAAVKNVEGGKGWIIRSLTRRRSAKKY